MDDEQRDIEIESGAEEDNWWDECVGEWDGEVERGVGDIGWEEETEYAEPCSYLGQYGGGDVIVGEEVIN